jgi:GTP-binding protein
MNELDRAAVSYQVVLTKADKPLSADVEKALAATRAAIAKRPAAHPHVLLTSSEKGTGIKELRTEIAMLLESGGA